MKRPTPSRRQSLFWIFQIIVGSICLILSAVVVFYGTTTTAGAYIWLFLAGIGLIMLGAERLISGLTAKGVKKSSRLINIGVGLGLIIYIGSGFFYPEFATKWLVIFLGFGLLANGVIRIVKSLKKKPEESYDYETMLTGILITSLSILILVYEKLGIALLLIMTAIALAVSGIQVILAGIRARRQAARFQTDSNEVIQTEKTGKDDIMPLPKDVKGFWKDGSWFRDEHGRYTIFRGVNFAGRSKLPPYLPISPLEVKELSKLDLENEIQVVKPGLDLLKTTGFNVARLLISWKALEPKPNSNLDDLSGEGKEYLSFLNRIIDELYKRNIYIILDFHQDIANEIYGGDGFPDWTIAVDKENPKPTPTQIPPPPDKKWQVKYMINKSLKHTLKSFWENDLTNTDEGLVHYPVRTHLEKTIELTVKHLQSLNNGITHPAILGVEPFNEPHPGLIPKEEFEVKYLMDFYRNVNSNIGKVDRNLFIFIEPRVDWTFPAEGSPMAYGAAPLEVKQSFNMNFIKKVMADKKTVEMKLVTYLPKDSSSISNFDSNGVLSFHFYDPMAVAASFVKIPESMYTYKKQFPEMFRQLSNAATERRFVPFLTEFGAFQEGEQVRDYLNLQYDQIDANLINSTIWNYDLYNTEDMKDNWNLENYSLLGPGRIPRNMDVVARPYPMRSSAKPNYVFFDIDSKYAAIVLEGKVVSEEPTIVFVPFEINYSPEFTVWATARNEIKWDKENQLLYWQPSKEYQYNYLIIGKGKIDQLDMENLPKKISEMAYDVSFATFDFN
ncbi:MAG TPA: cellulase family glycosylhydrolase [Candidatus Nitrosocosmicus sp.]|nr:cellulase family glycosylhydrolase [Candidatus Nitrosocosmicus sp.]